MNEVKTEEIECGGGNRWRGVGFFFQAEDGIRDRLVTGVQTCALPISSRGSYVAGDKRRPLEVGQRVRIVIKKDKGLDLKIGRASCRERV